MSRQIVPHHRQLRYAGCLVVALVASWPAGATPPPEAANGLDALQNGKYEAAHQAFAEQLRAVEAGNDPRLKSNLHFYLGLARQKQAESAAGENQEHSRRWYEESRSHYEQALREAPPSGGILNNLAQVYQRLGEDQKAAETFEKAIALRDTNQSTYTVNYAEYLSTRNVTDAIRFYREALKQQPTNERAHRELLKLFTREDPSNVSDYAWWLYENGLVPRTEATVFELLTGPDAGKFDHERLLTCLCRCLSAHPESPEDFAIGSTAESLKKFLSNPNLKAPAEEILRLYSADRPDRSQFPWWANAISLEQREEIPRGGWPLEAFGALICALGDRYIHQKEPKKAENYYLCAFDLNKRHLDPEALLKLADLWVRTGQRRRLEDFLPAQEPEIFHGKGEAIGSMRLERVYAFHRALGILYSHLEKWGNASTPASAIFQLQRALDAARQYNEQVAGKEKSELLVDPRLVTLLARGYQQAGQPARARQLRIEQAEYFRSINRPDEAAYLLRPLRRADVPGGPRAPRQDFKPADSRDGDRELAAGEPPKRGTAPGIRILPPNHVKLDEKETRLIEQSLRQLLALKQQEQRTSTGRFEFMPDKVDRRIVRVEFDGVAGAAFFQRAPKDGIEVKFRVYGDVKTPVKPFRFMRPGATLAPSGPGGGR